MEPILKLRFETRRRVYEEMMATDNPRRFLACGEKYTRLTTEIATISNYRNRLHEIPARIMELESQNRNLMERMRKWNCLNGLSIIENNLRIRYVLQEMLDTASDLSGYESPEMSEVPDPSPSTDAQESH